jgi:hypothetical protein
MDPAGTGYFADILDTPFLYFCFLGWEETESISHVSQ